MQTIHGKTARILMAVALLALAGTARGLDPAPAPNPITVKEIGDSLRSGTPSAALVTSVTTRKLLEAPKPAEEADLRAAGASPHLLEIVKSSAYTLSPFEANDARKRLAAAASAPAGSAPAGTGIMPGLLHGKLVTWQGGGLKNYDETKLAGKKYYALYYSAEWCPPCRKFTPKLVQFYDQVAAQHPEMEVVFLSSDNSAADMQKYMQGDKMSWPAVRFEQLAQSKELQRYAGSGIPCLVLVDENGKVLSDSFAGKTYLGPYKVANDLAKLLKVPIPMPGY